MEDLLDDPERRAQMGALGRERVLSRLGWEHSESALRTAYAHAVDHRAPAPTPAQASLTMSQAGGE